jgi:DNA-binding MarR family transcriptional regulator
MSVTQHPDTDPTAPRLPELLAGAKELMLGEMRERLAAAGFGEIRATHGCVFRFVPADGMRLTDLAVLAEITKQTCSEIVSELEGLGYVERLPDPGDRRAKIIRLTDRGAAAQAEARRLFAEIEAEWAERLGGERMAMLRELLEEIAAAEAIAAEAA